MVLCAFVQRLILRALFRNLFLGYYLPFRHPVPLWEMENDYYLHNFHTSGVVKDCVGRYGRLTSMKAYERAFGIDWREEDDNAGDDDFEARSKACSTVQVRPSSTGQRSSTPGNSISSSWDGESKSVVRVRKRCKEQQAALSIWWKVALQSNLKERFWVRLGTEQEESLLPGRFERVYQPEKLSQFDRFFSRTWETPVRRTHAAQHSETIDDEDATANYSRVISSDCLPSSSLRRGPPPADTPLGAIKLSEFVSDYGFVPREAPSMKLFVERFNTVGGHHSLDYITQSDASRMNNPPDEYVRYCAPARQAFDRYDETRADEFVRALRDISLSSDDVTGISEVCSPV
jgi:hypothetical protein